MSGGIEKEIRELREEVAKIMDRLDRLADRVWFEDRAASMVADEPAEVVVVSRGLTTIDAFAWPPPEARC